MQFDFKISNLRVELTAGGGGWSIYVFERPTRGNREPKTHCNQIVTVSFPH